MDFQLWVTETMGGKFIAEVFRKGKRAPLDAKIFDDIKEARAWAEKVSNTVPLERAAWWNRAGA